MEAQYDGLLRWIIITMDYNISMKLIQLKIRDTCA